MSYLPRAERTSGSGFSGLDEPGRQKTITRRHLKRQQMSDQGRDVDQAEARRHRAAADAGSGGDQAGVDGEEVGQVAVLGASRPPLPRGRRGRGEVDAGLEGEAEDRFGSGAEEVELVALDEAEEPRTPAGSSSIARRARSSASRSPGSARCRKAEAAVVRNAARQSPRPEAAVIRPASTSHMLGAPAGCGCRRSRGRR